MTNTVNFDALSRKTVESDGALADLNNLYGAAFALEKWHFIARGERPRAAPYIASNAGYAGGRQMVRAFTDTDRLLRFARENNLTQPDGSAPILSLPTVNIIDYLEQLIPYDVHGIWFNSDTESDGFFLPLKQLRPVKEHLAKINRSAPAASVAGPALETLIVIVKDGLLLPSGFISQASYTCNFFCRVPPAWTENGKLLEIYLERLYEQVYGPDWRLGNSDGSRYVVIDSYSQVFAPDVVKTTQWSGTENTPENHFWFYITSETGEIRNVTGEEFQASVDSAFSAGV